MRQGQNKHDVLLEDLGSIVREMVTDLDDSARNITKKPAGIRLSNLQGTVCDIDAPLVHRPVPLERYTKEWIDFIGGSKKSLDKRAIGFLCWVPEIAIDTRFLACVESSGITLNRRFLGGLVRSCHCMWEDVWPEGTPVHMVRSLLSRYRGTDQALLKWQAHLDALLAEHSPQIMADRLLCSGRGLTSFVDEWHIEPQSAFFRRVIEVATAACRNRLDQPTSDLLVLVFRDLLPWPGWKPSNFKKEIGEIILYRPMSNRSREMIQRFVLHFEGLGDPRMSANRLKWMEVPQKAKDRLIHWLGQENRHVFSEHVYQQGKGWVWKQMISIWDPLSFENADRQ
ncbi:MAG: hypothetical protein A4E62_02052 [Syntrophorhabdus sp. PtaU1.Bin002]|nr:MAG: hypothetical protein A4E62_02052 [Syntrophorhabdus sp. PtaU1.Bin002]